MRLLEKLTQQGRKAGAGSQFFPTTVLASLTDRGKARERRLDNSRAVVALEAGKIEPQTDLIEQCHRFSSPVFDHMGAKKSMVRRKTTGSCV
jgi:hypothetical protein